MAEFSTDRVIFQKVDVLSHSYLEQTQYLFRKSTYELNIEFEDRDSRLPRQEVLYHGLVEARSVI